MNTLLNKLYTVIRDFKEYLKIFPLEDYELYQVLFKLTYHGIEQIQFQEIAYDVSLNKISKNIKDIAIELRLLSKTKRIYASKMLASAIENFKTAKNWLLCDCLSFPEYLYLIIKYKIPMNRISCTFNPSGKTGTFKFLMKIVANINLDTEITMGEIGDYLKNKYPFTNFNLYSNFDKFVHQTAYNALALDNLLYYLYKNLMNLCNILQRFRESTILIADHGYDVVLMGKKYKLNHKWHDKLNMSIFVPIIYLR